MVRVSPAIRDAIHNHWNKLNIGATCVRVHDRFYIKRCNRCNKFGHYKDKCSEASSCGTCTSEVHETDVCPNKNKEGTAHLKCINCKKAKEQFHGHSASYYKCPTYLLAQKKLKSNTPYYQAAKNRPLNPRH